MNNASAETRQQRRARERAERRGTPQPQKGAFKRAYEQFQQIASVREMNYLLGPVTLQLALMQLMALIGPYRSRGKGRGGVGYEHNRQAARSKYMPHQGEQECERRRIGGFYYERKHEALYRGSLRDAEFS